MRERLQRVGDLLQPFEDGLLVGRERGLVGVDRRALLRAQGSPVQEGRGQVGRETPETVGAAKERAAVRRLLPERRR